MWAIRRAFNPMRSHGALRVCSGKLELLSDISKHGISNPEHGPSRPDRCYVSPPTRFAHSRSSGRKFSKGTQTLSSQAGTEHSENEDDEFSELEAPENNVDGAGEENVVEEGIEQLVSEPELSGDEIEAGVGAGKGTRGSTNSPLFDVLLDTPRLSMNTVLDKWVADGNPLGRTEIGFIMLNFRKRKMFGKALQLAEWVEANKRVDFTERDYASRLDLIAKVHGLHRAEKYIEKIPSSFRGEVIYRTLLANCSSLNNLKKAEQVFNKMREMDFTLTAFSVNQLLILYKKLDRKRIADVLMLMEKENITPTLFTYKILIDTKGCGRDIDGMEQVIEKMKSDGMEPDLQIQAMITRHYIFAGLNEKAETMLKEIEGEGIRQNRSACRVLLPLYASLGKADEVGRIWKACESSPRLDECLAAIEAWGKLGQIEEAEAVFEMMLKSWKKLSSKYYTNLLKVYANHKMLNKGKELAKRMADNGCRIGPVTWDALVKLYVEAGEVEKADSILLKAAQQHNPKKPLYSSYMTIMNKYAKRGDVHNTEKMFNRLRQDGYVGRLSMYQALLLAYVNAKTPAYGFRERLKADDIFPNRPMATQLALVDAFKKTAISDLLD